MKAAQLLFIVLCLFATLGCARRETAVEAGLRTQTLHVSNGIEPDSLDPHVLTSDNAARIANALFEGLVNQANDGVTILPGVASRWEISPDGRNYVFHLRPEARWSDGSPLTAHDFVASFQRILEPELGGTYSNYAFPIEGAQDFAERRSRDFSNVGVRAADAQTLLLTLKQRTPSLLGRLTRPPFLPVHLPTVEKAGSRMARTSSWTRPEHWVSNGAFVLQRWRNGEVVVLRKNPRYWDAKRVTLEEIRFYPMESAVAERAFRAGQLHVSSLPHSRLIAHTGQTNPSLRLAPQIATSFLMFNVERPPFSDARVRRALALGLSRADIISGALGGRATAAHSLTWPGSGGYTGPKLFRENNEEARRLLASAGFAGGAGLPPIEIMLGGIDPLGIKVAEIVQEAWRKNLGLAVTLTTPEWTVFRDYRRTGNYRIAFMEWPHWINDPSDILEIGLRGVPINYSRWSHATYEAKYREAEQARTEAERYAALDAIEALLAEEAPYLPLYHPFQARLVHPAVRGLRDNPLGFIGWRELSLQPESRR